MYRTWAEISLSRIAANYRALREVAGPAVTTVPVVKADAYRHGAVPVAARLQAEGATWMAVSNSGEGVQLRLGGITAGILVMGDFAPFERESLASSNLTPVIHSLTRLREYDEFARLRGAVLPYHLKIDTGMGRLGTRASVSEILEAIHAATSLRLEGLMTHFASASDFTSPQTAGQVAAFDSVRQALALEGVCPPMLHLSSSAPVAFGMREVFGSMVRPGLALYGYVSAPAGEAPPVLAAVAPALTWRACILEIKEVAPGDPIGYGARWRAPRHSKIAVAAAGYADGVPHTLSNRGHALAAGRLVPLVGAVSMDLITLDVTECRSLRPGDPVTLIGTDGDARYDAEDMAREAGIISYAVLCGIGHRVTRVYVD